MNERLQQIASYIARNGEPGTERDNMLRLLFGCVEEFDHLHSTVEAFITEKEDVIRTLTQALDETQYTKAKLHEANELLVDQRKQMQVQEAELENALRLADEGSRKSDFLSTMSHEIRSPLNAIIGMSYILLQEKPKPEQIKNLNILKFSAENLLSLVNDILDFSKIEAGKIELDNREFDLKQFIQQIMGMFNISAQEKNIKLRSILDSDLPQHVKGDVTRLNQVLTNLLSNAIKFTDKGSVTLEVSLLQKSTDKSKIEFRVADTGIGVAVDKQSTIFESFRQAERNTSGRYGGTGLGLSIIKSLLELMNSDVQLSSQPGVGSEFLFTLEFETPLHGALFSNSLRQVSPADYKRMDGYKVLLVEDNEFNIVVARTYLENWGLKVDIAKDGERCIQRAKEETFDLILLDLQMPRMNGIEATTHIRASSVNTTTPIIALSATVSATIRAEVMQAGMNDYLAKPFNPMDLHKKISTHLHQLRRVA